MWRIGARTSVWLGLLPYMLGFGLLFFATTWWHVLFCYLVIMLGKSLAGTSGVAIDAMLVDDNEQLTGTRKTGQLAAVRAILGAPVTGVQLVLYMAILSATGYQAGAETQSPEAQMGIRIATCLVPIAFCLVSLVPLLFLPYTRERERELMEFSRQRRAVDPEGDEAATVQVVSG